MSGGGQNYGASGSTAQPWSAFGKVGTPGLAMDNRMFGYQNYQDPSQQYMQYQPYQQQQQQQQQQTTPYYQTGQNLGTQSQIFDMSGSPDQVFLQQFNGSHGTNYSALSQLPANDYQAYLQSGGQMPGGQPSQTGSPFAAPKGVTLSEGPQNGFARTLSGNQGQATFRPPAYPSWLYGPMAGLFGGTPPQGTPMNYGYFPTTQTWGAQPNGSNFNAG